MASGSTTLSTLLAGLKAHAGAAAVAGAVVVAGGAAAAAAATGHLGNNSSVNNAPGAATQVANCAGHNGDAANLAVTYKSMFGGDASTATKDICTIFVGTSGRHYGFGEVRQILNIAAAIENKGSSACLSASSAPGDSGTSGDHSKPTATPGKSGGDHGRPTATPGSSGDHGQPSLKIPSASAADAMANVQSILSYVNQGVTLAKLAQSCGAPLGSNQ
jgi:hypothetical protein